MDRCGRDNGSCSAAAVIREYNFHPQIGGKVNRLLSTLQLHWIRNMGNARNRKLNRNAAAAVSDVAGKEDFLKCGNQHSPLEDYVREAFTVATSSEKPSANVIYAPSNLTATLKKKKRCLVAAKDIKRQCFKPRSIVKSFIQPG